MKPSPDYGTGWELDYFVELLLQYSHMTDIKLGLLAQPPL